MSKKRNRRKSTKADKARKIKKKKAVRVMDNDLTQDFENDDDQSELKVIRIGGDEVAVSPITKSYAKGYLHYLKTGEYTGYSICNFEIHGRCAACDAGIPRNKRIFLAVVDLASKQVGILLVSTSLRPKALLPPVINILKSDKAVAVFIRREGQEYSVNTKELTQSKRKEIKPIIKDFMKQYEDGKIDITDVYPTIDNSILADIEEIK